MVKTVCYCNSCLLTRERLDAATATDAVTTENPPVIDPARLEKWLAEGIRLEREASDPDGILAGLETVMQALQKRSAYWAEILRGEVKPLPVLDGIYDQSGLGDAVGALVSTMVNSPSKKFRVVVTEED